MSATLLIDDEESIRWSLALILEMAGHEVHTASDYDSAIDQLSRRRFDVVISDLLLPGRSGLEILEWLNRQGRDEPLVIITGQPEQETACRGYELGIFEYLTKPVRKESLLGVIEQVERLKDATRRNRGPKLPESPDVPCPLFTELEAAREFFRRELLERLPAGLRSCFTIEYLARLFDDSCLAIGYVEGEKVCYLNRRFTEITGFTAEDVTPLDKAFEHIYPDPEVRKLIRETRNNGILSAELGNFKPFYLTVPFVTKAGPVKTVSFCSLYLPRGRALYSLVEMSGSSDESGSE